MMSLAERYNVALSFAGEDRAYARALADALKQRGVKVFYDEYEEANLWGEDLYTYLSDLYQNRAQYVVMFLSQHYAAKLWTNHERRASQARAFQESRSYILPIRLDDTTVEGVLPTTGYIRWSKEADSIADLILKKLGIIINPQDNAELMFIPAGEFIMGSDDTSAEDDARPSHTIYLDAYYIYKMPVTVGQFRNFCTATGHTMPPSFGWEWEDNHPIVNVTWHEAQAYGQWAGVRLPTEAQWEKAARGTDGRRYSWGNKWDAENCQWHRLKYGDAGTPSRVGSYPQGASPYGVQDMVGNVWEWCADWYDPGYYLKTPDRNPQGPTSGTERVMKGCSWADDFLYFPINFACAHRDKKGPGNRYILEGFRCVGHAGFNDNSP
jgi:sulfatase modifying factor 1